MECKTHINIVSVAIYNTHNIKFQTVKNYLKTIYCNHNQKNLFIVGVWLTGAVCNNTHRTRVRTGNPSWGSWQVASSETLLDNMLVSVRVDLTFHISYRTFHVYSVFICTQYLLFCFVYTFTQLIYMQCGNYMLFIVYEGIIVLPCGLVYCVFLNQV